MDGLHVAALCVLVGTCAVDRADRGDASADGAAVSTGRGGASTPGATNPTLHDAIIAWLLQHAGERLWKLPEVTLEQLAAKSADFQEVYSYAKS